MRKSQHKQLPSRKTSKGLIEGAISRKTFLQGSGAALLASVLPTRGATAATPAPVEEVAEGIFVHTGKHSDFSLAAGGDVGNFSFIIGKDSVAVIDTGGNRMVGDGLRAAVRAKTDRPIRFVINTHMHPDHVLGNGAFKDEKVEFVAHHKMGRGLAARADRYLSVGKKLQGDTAFAGTEVILPTKEINDKQTLDLGDRRLVLTARPTAHTDNDLTIYDEATGTLFLGDLLFAQHVPTLDGSIVGWLALIKTLKSEQAKQVVPGHGPARMKWPEAIGPLERYLETVAKEVRNKIAAGESLTDAAKTVARSEEEAWLLFDSYHGRNVAAAFAELEWE